MPAQQVLRIFFYCCPVKLIMWSKTGFLARLVHLRQVHPLSVPPFASAVQSDSVRRPIGFRPPSDRIPFAVQSDSVRVTMTFHEGFIANICQAERLIATAQYFFTRKPTYL